MPGQEAVGGGRQAVGIETLTFGFRPSPAQSHLVKPLCRQTGVIQGGAAATALPGMDGLLPRAESPDASGSSLDFGF